MSTFPIIPAFPADGDPAFNAKARAVMDALATGSVEANAAFGQLSSAMTTLEASVNATVWVSGTAYTVGQRVYDPGNNYLMYVRLIAGAGATNPNADPTNWLLLSHKALPLVVVTGTTHTLTKNTHAIFTNAAKCTVTLPASASSDDEWAITWSNGRTDNEYLPNGLKLLGQTDAIAEDLTASGTVFGRYTTTDYGWSLN